MINLKNFIKKYNEIKIKIEPINLLISISQKPFLGNFFIKVVDVPTIIKIIPYPIEKRKRATAP